MDGVPLSGVDEISYWELKEENGRLVFLIDNGEKETQKLEN